MNYRKAGRFMSFNNVDIVSLQKRSGGYTSSHTSDLFFAIKRFLLFAMNTGLLRIFQSELILTFSIRLGSQESYFLHDR